MVAIDALKLAAASYKAALQNDDREALVAAARQLLKFNAPLGPQWRDLANAVFRWGELTLALQALDCWQRQFASAEEANYEKAVLLARSGRAEEAAALTASLPENVPTPVANAYLRGALATNLARSHEAEAHFRRALRAAPDSGRSWLGLVQLGRATDADHAAVRRLAETGSVTDDEDRAAVENALGLIEHRRGNHAKAFAHFDRSSQIIRQTRPYSASDNYSSAQVATSWTRAEISKLAERPPGAARPPIFVTGLPRSGTTLVQQILAANSVVDSGAELGLAVQIEAIAGGFAPTDIGRYLAGGGTVAHLREVYLRLVGERIPGSGAFVDKTLNQSRSLGPFSVLFPEAPIIWLRRDPLDNAWSIYRTWMSNSAVGGWSLADIADHMTNEDRLLAHWMTELPGRILVVPYEELVDNPEHWIERITRHCGLQVEQGQLQFYNARSSVATASSLQVREPVNRRSIGSAEAYRAYLEPFIERYSPARAEPQKDRPEARPEALTEQFVQALRRQDREKVRETASAMLGARVQLGRQWRSVAQAMLKDGELALARQAADLLTEQIKTPGALFEAAAIHAQSGRPQRAAEMLSKLPEDVPDPVANAYTRGTLAANLGRMEDAREALRRAVDLAPRSGQAWLALVMSGGLDDAYGAGLAEQEASFAQARGEDRASYLVALGRWHERQGDRAAAVAAYTASGEALKDIRPYDFAADKAEVEAIVSDWRNGRIAELLREWVAGRATPPIFVTGLPRSGTTLVEQILASHSSVVGGGEVELLRHCSREIGARTASEISGRLQDSGTLSGLAEYYSRLAAERFGEGLAVDKSLSTSRYAGLAAAMFPDARFVWVVRDARDCAWSAFRSYFVAGASWSNRLTDIGRHFALEDQLRTFWSAELGERMLIVSYVDLVTDPRTTIGRIAAHCGLEAEPAMFEPHRTERAVTTNSAAQVREPITSSAVGSSAPFADFLAPFEEAYREAAREQL